MDVSYCMVALSAINTRRWKEKEHHSRWVGLHDLKSSLSTYMILWFWNTSGIFKQTNKQSPPPKKNNDFSFYVPQRRNFYPLMLLSSSCSRRGRNRERKVERREKCKETKQRHEIILSIWCWNKIYESNKKENDGIWVFWKTDNKLFKSSFSGHRIDCCRSLNICSLWRDEPPSSFYCQWFVLCIKKPRWHNPAYKSEGRI